MDFLSFPTVWAANSRCGWWWCLSGGDDVSGGGVSYGSVSGGGVSSVGDTYRWCKMAFL
jgi:hypothetical protein